MDNTSDLDTELQIKRKVKKSNNPWGWARFIGDIFADLGENLLAFIPNGLNTTYDSTLKQIPYLKTFFGHSWVEDTMKLLMGVTIGRGLSKDVGRYLFWPIGFFLGLPLGLLTTSHPKYQQQAGRVLCQLSGQTVAGALSALCIAAIFVQFQPAMAAESLSWEAWALIVGAGAAVGFVVKLIMLIAVNAVTRSNAASSRLNAKRARKIGQILKTILEGMSHRQVYFHARSIVEQMHGPQTDAHMESFFAENHDAICQGVFKKIQRHINYLSDRATHGDMNSLKKLMLLYRNRDQKNGMLEEILERVMDEEEVFALKDAVDNLYDNWSYRDLRKKVG